MFAYCGNNPVIFVDWSGQKPAYIGDPTYEWAWNFGWYLKELTDKDRNTIKNGEVTYSSNGTGNGAKIENSYKISTPWVMHEYVSANRSDDIQGTTTGVVAEWVFHNFAYWLGDTFKQESIKNSAAHAEVGKTIYADRRNGLGVTTWMSAGMQSLYTIFLPLHASYDLAVQTERWDFAYARE